jgi:hypothetical protein
MDAMIQPLTGTSFYVPDAQNLGCWQKLTFIEQAPALNLTHHDSVTDFLYFARNHWRPEVIDQRAANRKMWFDVKFPERKLIEVIHG